MFSLVETIGFHQLEADWTFSKQIFEDLDDENEEEHDGDDQKQFDHFVKEVLERLERRLHLAKLVVEAQKKVGPKMLNITDNQVWENVRFMKICNIELKKKLENQNNKKKFI